MRQWACLPLVATSGNVPHWRWILNPRVQRMITALRLLWMNCDVRVMAWQTKEPVALRLRTMSCLVAVATSSSFTQGVLREGASQPDGFFRFMEPRETAVMLSICTRCPRVQSSGTEKNMRSADQPLFCMQIGCSAAAFLTRVGYYYCYYYYYYYCYCSAAELFLYWYLYLKCTIQLFLNGF